MRDHIEKIKGGIDLTDVEAADAMKQIMSGNSSEEDLGDFLLALNDKGESPGEIAAMAKVMREYAVKIEPKVDGLLVDMCGTGGDGSKTFNISTCASFIVAAYGIPVAKHGNRSITSKCGSADVLEALGVKLDVPAEKIRSCIEDVGIGFMFAPAHHPAMKHVMPVRKKLGIRTVFNILGPLTNPAGAKAQLMGVFDPNLTETLAEVFKLLGLERALVVHGEPKMDELSTLGATKVSELRDGEISTYEVNATEYGLAGKEISTDTTVEDNADIIRNVLEGKGSEGDTEIVLLNAAGGLIVGGAADDFRQGIERARMTIESGDAIKKLYEFIDYTND